MYVRLKSRRNPPRPNIWVTEINVDDENVSEALEDLIRLVREHEDLS
jgi:hypothetical protein